MATSTTPSLPALNLSAPEQAVILRALAAAATGAAVAQFDAFSDCLEAALATSTEPHVTPEEAGLCRQAWQLLSSNRGNFQRYFETGLRDALQRQMEALTMDADPRQPLGLALMSAAEPDALHPDAAQLALIDAYGKAIDLGNVRALALLNHSLAVLLQRAPLDIASNPFRAATFLHGFACAWSRFDPNRATLDAVLRQLRPEIFLQMAGILAAVQRRLALQLPQSAAPMPAAPAEPSPTASAEPATPVPTASDPEAVQRQQHEQRFAQLAADDAHAARLVAELFDGLRDQSLPAPVQKLIERVQPAVRAAALADRDFFLHRDMPVRRLLDLITRAGALCDPAGEPAGGKHAGHEEHDEQQYQQDQERRDTPYQVLVQVVERMLREPEPQPDLFDSLCGTLEALIGRLQVEADPRLQAAITDARSREKLAQEQAAAERDIGERIATGEVAGFVELFLQMQWVKVLALAHGMRESKPDTLACLQRAMDDLIWSVRPKASNDERKELLGRLPALLSLLNAWLNVVKWSGPERDAFFTTLAERHATVVRTQLETMPRKQLEIAMNVAQRASEHRLNRRAQEQAGPDPVLRQIAALAIGDRLLQEEGASDCRLAWISPARICFVLEDPRTQRLSVMTAAELAHGLGAATLAITVAGSPLEKAWSEVRERALRDL